MKIRITVKPKAPTPFWGNAHKEVVVGATQYLDWVMKDPLGRGEGIRRHVLNWARLYSPPLELGDCLGFWTDALVGMLTKKLIPPGKLRKDDFLVCASRVVQLMLISCPDLCVRAGWLPFTPIQVPLFTQYEMCRTSFDSWIGLTLQPAIRAVMYSYPELPVDGREGHLFADWLLRKDELHLQKDWVESVRQVQRGQGVYEASLPPAELHRQILLDAREFLKHKGVEALRRQEDGKVVVGKTQYRDALEASYKLPRIRPRKKKASKKGGSKATGAHTTSLDPIGHLIPRPDSIEACSEADEIREALDFLGAAEVMRGVFDRYPILGRLREEMLFESGQMGNARTAVEFLRFVEILDAGVRPARKAAIVYEYGLWAGRGKLWTRAEAAVAFEVTATQVDGLTLPRFGRHRT